MIQHNVFFKWKPSMTRELEAQAFAAFPTASEEAAPKWGWGVTPDCGDYAASLASQ